MHSASIISLCRALLHSCNHPAIQRYNQLLIYPINSLVINLIVHPFIQLRVHSHVKEPIHSCVHSFTHSFNHRVYHVSACSLLVELLVHSSIHKLDSTFAYSSIHRSTLSIPPSIICPSIHPLMPPLTIHPVFPSATSVFPRSVKAAPAPPAEAAVCASASAN